MKAWLSRLQDLTIAPATPEELASFELSHALPSFSCKLETVPAFGESYRVQRTSDGGYLISGGPSGVLYGAYALIRAALSGYAMPEELASAPRYSMRMIDCWDNADGSVERGYSTAGGPNSITAPTLYPGGS